MASKRFIYRVTIQLHESINPELFIQWMVETHIPDLMDTNCFSGFRFSSALHNKHEFTTDYFYAHPDDFERYENEFALKMRSDFVTNFGNISLAQRSNFEIKSTYD